METRSPEPPEHPVVSPVASSSVVASIPYAAAGVGDAFWRDWTGEVNTAGEEAAKGGFERLRPFLKRNPREAADRRRAVEELRERSAACPRAELAGVLEKRSRRLDAPEAVLANCRLLSKPDTFAVLTGQQPGLLGGPLYTFYKALTAVELARALSEEFPYNFVPVFWTADDDHDLDEVNRFTLLCRNGRLARFRLKLPPEARGRSLSDVLLPPDEVRRLADETTAALGPRASGEWAEIFAPYLEGCSFGEAFMRLLTRLLGGEGLITAAASDLRGLGRDLFAEELNRWPETCAFVRAAGEAMRAAGREPGFEMVREGPQLFLEEDGYRARLEPAATDEETEQTSGAEKAVFQTTAAGAAEGFRPPVRTYSKEELLKICRESPERCTPAAALRVLVQNSLFPVAAAVLGPGEVRYWAQLAGLHERRGVFWPLLFPRLSATLLDRRAARIRHRLGLGGAELFRPREAWEARRREDRDGEGKAAMVETHAARIGLELQALERPVLEADGGLRPLLEKARRRVEHELARLTEKVRYAEERQAGTTRAHFDYLAALLRPRGKPQERVLSVAQFAVTSRRYDSGAEKGSGTEEGKEQGGGAAEGEPLVRVFTKELSPFAFSHHLLEL